MNRVNDQVTGFWVLRPPALDAVLARLKALSLEPEFRLQRELAISRALKSYLQGAAGTFVQPDCLPSQGDGVYNHAAGHEEIGRSMESGLRRNR